jgi:phenylpropionate dioxygenase-like ring-hydroxylating dioxygenase large terminal subunit
MEPTMTFLTNAWYVVAWEEEIPVGELFHRTIWSEPVLLYRTAADEIVALADRCPHRFAPLHLGRLVGDVVQCGYHGLCFGPTGDCVKSPHGDGKIPRGAKVRRYVTARKHRAVWIWAGEAARADLSLIPDYSFLVQPKPNAAFTGYLPTACNYQLATDNIMDLSHADYLHVGSLDTQGAIAQTRAKVWEDGRSVHCDWWLPNSRAIGVFKPDLAEPEGPVDQWFEVCWDPPGLMLLRAGVTPAGRPREEGVDVRAVHIMTPETQTRTHYFFGSARTIKGESVEFNEKVRAGVIAAFTYQDKPMLEAQQVSIGTADLMSLRPISLLGDAGGLRVRRALQKLLDAQEQPPSVEPAPESVESA